MTEARFREPKPTAETSWRSVVLFGMNVASYKFALAKSLLELADAGEQRVTLAGLAAPFSGHICEHLKAADTQGTFNRSRFLDACRSFNAGGVDQTALIATTERLGFQNVIDAFHVVQGNDVAVRFFHDERRSRNPGIQLDDALFDLRTGEQGPSLAHEAEARWRLVETAWELQVPRAALAVTYQADTQFLFAESPRRRKAVTGARDALNGYQKGKCFYCFAPIGVRPGRADLGQVDHFFPHALKGAGIAEPIDGIWNLVLACGACNNWNAKSSRVPVLRYLERLDRRNERLIQSHHPLRETLMAQTGKIASTRAGFLNHSYQNAKLILNASWEAPAEAAPAF